MLASVRNVVLFIQRCFYKSPYVGQTDPFRSVRSFEAFQREARKQKRDLTGIQIYSADEQRAHAIADRIAASTGFAAVIQPSIDPQYGINPPDSQGNLVLAIPTFLVPNNSWAPIVVGNARTTAYLVALAGSLTILCDGSDCPDPTVKETLRSLHERPERIGYPAIYPPPHVDAEPILESRPLRKALKSGRVVAVAIQRGFPTEVLRF